MSAGPRQLVVQAGAVAVKVSDVLSIARSAGEAILDVYKTDVEVSMNEWGGCMYIVLWWWVVWRPFVSPVFPTAPQAPERCAASQPDPPLLLPLKKRTGQSRPSRTTPP